MLHHVALEVRREDVDAEAAFWALLGFEPVEVPESLAGRTTWVQRGEQQIHLLWGDDPTIPPEGHVAVVLGEHYEGVREAVGAAPRAEHWGSPRAFARTPAGHRVELMERPPCREAATGSAPRS